ncbi:MAG: type II secretion system protein GspM [Marinobacterium sp.]|nr:type II secretion system protein GspM [Marinobacterium sp.]
MTKPAKVSQTAQITQFSPRLQRFLAIIILMLLILAGLLLLQPLLQRYQHSHEQLHNLQTQIQRYQQINASAEPLQQQRQQLQHAVINSQALLNGRTVALRSANLQQFLRTVLDQNGAELIRVRALAPEQQDTLEVIRLQVQLQASLTQLLNTLNTLQQHQPLLTVSHLTISSRPTAPLRGQQQDIAWPLQIRFQLSGYSHQE